MAPVVGITVFPGTNCEHDVAEVLAQAGAEPVMLWHGEATIDGADAIVVPGGFAHGDYLRTGAIARFSPVMGAVAAFAESGGPVVGICNGFQILTEAGLLPGALQKNSGLRFICAPAELRVETTDTPLTSTLRRQQTLRIPINHFAGNYTCSAETLVELRDNDQVVLTYTDNPNGSVGDIAGVCNRARNVVGLMPHPERACHRLLGGVDGQGMIASLVSAAGAAPASR